MSSAVSCMIYCFTLAQVVVQITASRHHCIESRVTVDRHTEVKVDCTAAHFSTVPMTAFPEDTTHLILSHLNIKEIPDNAFAQLHKLRFLDLSNNNIQTLRNASFHGLAKLQMLNLNGNAIDSTERGVFSDLQALDTLLVNNLVSKSYDVFIEPINTLNNIRVLSLTMTEDPSTMARLGPLPKLRVLDFFYGDIGRITISLMDNFRRFNLSSLAFRNQNLESIEPGAFSNFSNLRSINLYCNLEVGYKEAIASLAQIQNTKIETVILDHIAKWDYGFNVFSMSDFCSPFGNEIRRLSLKNNFIVSIDFKNIECLAELRELDLSYNPIVAISSMNFTLYTLFSFFGQHWPYLCSISFSMNTNYDKEDAALLYNADWYFSINPTCLTNLSDDGQMLPSSLSSISKSKTEGQFPRDADIKDVQHVIMPTSLQIIRLVQVTANEKPRMRRSVAFNDDNNIRYINTSYSSLPVAFTASYYGLHKLETVDISHSDILELSPKYVHFPNLKSLNISHNQLQQEPSLLCNGCPMLEDIDMSNNRFQRLDPFMFSTCRHLKHINLDGNPLQDVFLDLSNHTRLETLSLRSTKIHDLGSKFTTELDDLFRVKTFSVDIRNNSFVCSCTSLDFIRWVQTTKIDLVAKDRLTCVLNERLTLLVHVDLTDLTAGCSHNGHVIVASIIIVFLGVVVVLAGLVWNRWYIKYRIILCSLSARSKRLAEHSNQYGATVLYFAYPSNPVDYDASRKIARWVIDDLRPIAEDEEDVKLFIADRDGLTLPKSELFISAFEQSEKLIVCITSEFLNDSFCMNNMNLALASKKPLSHFIFIDFCDKSQTIPSRHLRHLLRGTSAATYIRWHNIDDDDNEAKRRLRGALNHGGAEDACSGLLGLVRDLPATNACHEQLNP